MISVKKERHEAAVLSEVVISGYDLMQLADFSKRIIERVIGSDENAYVELEINTLVFRDELKVLKALADF